MRSGQLMLWLFILESVSTFEDNISNYVGPITEAQTCVCVCVCVEGGGGEGGVDGI